MEEESLPEKRGRRGLTVSDLHLFSDYTKANELLPLLDAAIEREGEKPADMVVLNGDIFDFEFPGNISFEDELEKLGFDLEEEKDKQTLEKLGVLRHVQYDLGSYKPIKDVDAVLNLAVAWLWKFCESHPQTQVHYIIGNHDGVYCPDGLENKKSRDFPSRLKKLKKVLKEEAGADNFHVHGETFSPAMNVMFTHGDLPMRKQNIHSRPYIPIDEVKSPDSGDEERKFHHAVEQWIYSNPTLLSLAHQYAGYHNRPQHIDPCVIRAQRKIKKGRHDLFHIFMGHTHVPRTNDKVEQPITDPQTGEKYLQRFHIHNTGSAVSRKEFNMLEFDLEETTQKREGKKDKVTTLLTEVRRAPELGEQPMGWVDKMKARAAPYVGTLQC